MQDWLTQELPFHVMRDNPAHVAVILGGMWGARYSNPTHVSVLLGGMWGAMQV